MKNVTVIIQGPTNYYKEILDNLSQNQTYIWSTWNNEPKENLDAISNKVKLILNEPPNFAGHANINCQCLSTFKGIEAAQTDYVFKTRGDMIFSNIDKLLEIISANNKEMSFLHYGNPPQQMADFFCFGEKTKALDYWNYVCRDGYVIAPEERLSWSYKNKINSQESFEEYMKRFFFFNVILKEKELDIFWLKINKWVTNFYKENLNLYPKS